MNDYSILDYGAEPGALCTAAIQKAFDAASATHGTVVVPAGEFRSGTLDMKGASLRLEKGAVLKASGDRADYRVVPYSHNEMGEFHSLLYCFDGEGVSLSGEGVIDLNGRAFFDFSKPVPYDGARDPMSPEELAECTVACEWRPKQPLFFLRCRHVTVRDLLIRDAPCWTMSFVECDDIRALDLTIDNGLNVPNCDGMHFCCCHDMFVRGCNISAGDDCVAFTGITDWNKPCERAVVSDCVFRSCSKAISIGYMHSIVRDIAVANCVVYGSNRACVLMASTGTGLVENVTLSHLRLDTRIRAGNWWGNGEPLCIMATPHNYSNYRDPPPPKRFRASIRNVFGSDLVCSGENAIAVVGVDGSVEGVALDGVRFTRKDSDRIHLKGHMVDLAPGEQNAVLPDDERAWLYLRDVRGSSFTRCIAEPWHGRPLEVVQSGCEDTRICP